MKATKTNEQISKALHLLVLGLYVVSVFQITGGHFIRGAVALGVATCIESSVYVYRARESRKEDENS